MEKIDINKLQCAWVFFDDNGYSIGGGDDTEKSLKIIGEKINELIDYVQSR